MPHHASHIGHPLTYRRIAVSFVVLTVILAGIALTLTLARATIAVAPEETPQRVEASITVEKAPLALAQDAIPGSVAARTVTLEGKAPISGKGEQIADRAHGNITVVNTYDKSQPLVATTRFLSSKGVLFRSTKTVSVPAGGKVTVEVRADKPGAEGDIPAGKFTIPGLWSGLQDKIYGTSDKPMVGGVRTVTKISETDIAKALASLASESEARLYQLSEEQGKGNVVVGIEKISEKVITPVGKEAEAAIVQGMYREVVVTYDRQALQELLKSMMARRAEYASRIDMQEPTVKFNRTTKEGALISVVQNGSTHTPFDPAKINAKILTGKKIEEAEQLLAAMPGVGDVGITMKPKFLKRLPRLRDHIRIVVQED